MQTTLIPIECIPPPPSSSCVPGQSLLEVGAVDHSRSHLLKPSESQCLQQAQLIVSFSSPRLLMNPFGNQSLVAARVVNPHQ